MARVLLVDDDIAEISAVKRVLARAGHLPVLATNAADALAAVARARPDLLVVGSGCEGGEALRRFGEDEGARGIPLVVLGESPAAPEGVPQVSRPVDPAELADRVAQTLAAGLASAAAAAAPPAASAPEPAAVPAPALRDGAAARRAAAEALRARAEELRRGGPPAPAPAPAAVAAPAPPPGLDLEDSGLEAILRRAEEAERAHAAEKKARARQADRATVEAAQRAEAEQIAVEKAARARAAEERVRTEQRARAEAEEKARAEAAQRAEAEERARAEAAQRAEAEERSRAETAQRAEAEEKARAEAAQRAQAEKVAAVKAERARAAEERARAEQRARAEAERQAKVEAAARARAEKAARALEEGERRAREDGERRAAEEEARRASDAEARARLEADARARLEDELEKLRDQVQSERRSAEERIHSVMERAAAEERAAEDLRRAAEEDAQRRLEAETRRREAEEEDLRSAISSARAEMEALRRKGEDEARRRAEAEAEIARLAREAERRAGEAAALPRPFDFPTYQPPPEDPAPDPAEEAARRRVATLKERAAAREEPAPAPAQQGTEAPPRPVRPPPPELRAGTLADLPAPRLLALAARAEVTGRLDVEGEVARSIWLEDGRVVGAASADPSERVEELALRLGLVTREQHRQVAGAAASLASRRSALLLLERGFLKPTELTALVRRRTEEVVFGIFADDVARFRWAPTEVPPDERTALERSTLALAVEGVRRRWLAPRVDAVLGGPGTLLSPLETGPTAADLALSAGERRAVALADGLRTVDEIVAGSPLDPLSTRQVLAALVLVGALAVRVFQGGRPAAAATAAIDLARVREKLDQARRADYFTILGVGRLCTPHEVREAAERLAAEFDPRRFQGVREEGLEGRLEEIRRVVVDAREILVDDRLRDEYLRGLGD